MAAPKRRSARLASVQRSTASPAPHLSSIAERDESGEKMKQDHKQINKPEAVQSSPIPNPSTPTTATPVKLPKSEMHPSKVHPSMAPPSSGLRLGFTDIRPDEKSKKRTKVLEAVSSSPMPHPSTPATSTPVKLPMSEMHPSKVHPTMAPPSSGLRLGFVDINPDERSKDQPSGVTQATPSKTPQPASSTFSFNLESEKDLGPEAKEMMENLRGETARIKAELAAKRQPERLEAELASRRIAQAKGRATRFTAAHMSEFKKMDSIENHPSLFRANPDRLTPLKAGIKRSQSKADLDEPESARSSKLTSSRSMPKITEKRGDEPESRIKRFRQRLEDDASTTRPVSRDGSAIPRPKSSGNDSVQRGIPQSQTHSSLTTPTKAFLSRLHSTKTPPTKTPTITLVKSPSKPELGTPTADGVSRDTKLRVDVAGLTRSSSKKGFGGLTKSHTISNLLDARSAPTQVQTPGRFGKVKSILKRQFSGSKTRSDAHPAASPNKTPGPQVANKDLPPLPLTTPGQKLVKRVEFTPKTKVAVEDENSPSPAKSGIPRSKTLSKLPTSKVASMLFGTAQKSDGDVSYPDLSAYTKDISGETETSQPKLLAPSVPGSFTFRSDHTIQFDKQPANGFGGAAGQASLRHVRDSNLFGSRMPGSFPRLPEAPKNEEIKEDKENADPQATPTCHRGSKAAATGSLVKGIPHGMSNKKRSRATSDDEDNDEGAERGAKKQRKNPNTVPEGDALLAPRLINKPSPFKKAVELSRTPSPRKKGGISLSRLNMLARPKIRK